MKEATRRHVLRTSALACATGFATATAGCSAIEGVLGGGDDSYRSSIAHPGWFDASASAVAPDGYGLDLVSYWDQVALRAKADALPDWLVSDGQFFGLDVPVEEHVSTLVPHPVTVASYADADALDDAVAASDGYEPVADVEGVYGKHGDDGVTVVRDGVAMNADRFDGGEPGSPVDDVAAHARMLEEREAASFETGIEAFSRVDRLVDAVGSQTIVRLFPRETNLDIGLKGVGEGFDVGGDRTEHRAVGLGEDLDPDVFEDWRVRAGEGYEPYEDVSVEREDGVVVLTGSVPTSEFDLLLRD